MNECKQRFKSYFINFLFAAIFEDAPAEYVPTRRSHRDRERDRDHESGKAEAGRSRTNHRHTKDDAEVERPTQPNGSGGRYFEKPSEPEPAVASEKGSVSATKDFIQQLATKFPTAAVSSKTNDEQVGDSWCYALILVGDFLLSELCKW